MHTRFIPRLLVVAFLFALVGTGLAHYSADAAERTQWTDTVSVEDGLVQSCDGFNVTGSYTADRAFLDVENYDGRQIYQRQDVTFAGAIGNATSGKSYAYSGAFTRIGNPELVKVKVINLSLRFEVDTPGEFSYSLARVDFDLSDNPHAIVKTVLKNALQMDVCQLFGGSTIGYGPIAPSSHPSADINAEITAPVVANIHTENSVLPGSEIQTTQDLARSIRSEAIEENTDADQVPVAIDNSTPWTELDPCDSSPPGQPC